MPSSDPSAPFVQTSGSLVVVRTTAVATMPIDHPVATQAETPAAQTPAPNSRASAPVSPSFSATSDAAASRSSVPGEFNLNSGSNYRSTGYLPATSTAEPKMINPWAIGGDKARGENNKETRAICYVNTKEIKLNCKMNEPSASGLASVELWCTKDARTWRRCGSALQGHPPYIAKVDEEGLYGFTLVAAEERMRNVPQPGDQPQMWVEVDVTKPVVRLLAFETSSEISGKSAKIRWTATDKNLSARPVKLSYANQPSGPWMTIAGDQESAGSYTWRMPAHLGANFAVRVEAADLAGNVGMDQSSSSATADTLQSVGGRFDSNPTRR